MFARVAFAASLSVAVIAGRPVAAAPVTYDFTGNFDRPMNGSTQFTSSVTFDANPTIPSLSSLGVIPDPNWAPGDSAALGEYGKIVSLTVNMGGQTIHYDNDPQAQFVSEYLVCVGSFAPMPGVTDPSSDVVQIKGFTPYYHPGSSATDNNFTMTFNGPAGTLFSRLALGQVANLATSNFESSFLSLTATDSLGRSYSGTLTSVERVTPVPEPSTVLLFGSLGLVAVVHRRSLARTLPKG